MTEALDYTARAIKIADGVDVSFGIFARSLHKFGVNPDVDTGADETVWITGGVEALPTGNTIDTIQSTDPADTQQILVTGATFEGGLVRRNTQTVTLNGTTPVALTTPMYRVVRGFNVDTTPFAGTVTVTSPAGTHLTILPGTVDAPLQQSRKCAFVVPSNEYFAMTTLIGGFIGASTGAEATLSLKVREPGGVFRERFAFSIAKSGTSAIAVPAEPPGWVRPGSDVRVDAAVTSNNTPVTATVSGAFAQITSSPFIPPAE